ncbi:ATPase family AAA domain-containing protein 1 [Galendromus occidentalis]|uniref:ATPase family AAA domain-containing protein 1 n=1 Tax=Galendromus occidentalis TaxID=34638 RepID=A0AAJ6VXX2_9ACAR|nr:ATPase family AAA domain-containing protein 1 [Galendromus occidentalis]
MGSERLSSNDVSRWVISVTLFGALAFFGGKWILDFLDPTVKQREDALKRAQKILSQIGLKNIHLSEHEMAVAAQLVDPKNIPISWDSIAGLDDVVQEIKETVILPIQKRHLFVGNSLIEPPKGVLLHGPPGCGKTMIAKATAKEAGARFINLDISMLTDKWYGESQKLAAAVFSLATKIQPCIIFIDEVDSFLRVRDSTDHEATAMMKAQFMSLWDGLATDNRNYVLIMGATNRPRDLDRAILRRMPAMFHIGLPNVKQRVGILDLLLHDELLADEVDIESLAKLTDGFSGSDLKELCRGAAVNRFRYLAGSSDSKNSDSNGSDDEIFHDALPPISLDDFMNSITKMQTSRVHAELMYMPTI